MQCFPGRVEYLNAIFQSSDQVMKLSWMMRRALKIFIKYKYLQIFTLFPKPFFASTSTAIFSVICRARQLLFTIFIKFRQKSFIIWFQIGSNFFRSGHKLHLKKRFLPILVRRQKIGKIVFFLNAICDPFQKRWTQSETIL